MIPKSKYIEYGYMMTKEISNSTQTLGNVTIFEVRELFKMVQNTWCMGMHLRNANGRVTRGRSHQNTNV